MGLVMKHGSLLVWPWWFLLYGNKGTLDSNTALLAGKDAFKINCKAGDPAALLWAEGAYNSIPKGTVSLQFTVEGINISSSVGFSIWSGTSFTCLVPFSDKASCIPVVYISNSMLRAWKKASLASSDNGVTVSHSYTYVHC